MQIILSIFALLSLIKGDRFSYSTFTDGSYSSTSSEFSSAPSYHAYVALPHLNPIVTPGTTYKTMAPPLVVFKTDKKQYFSQSNAGEIAYGHVEEKQSHNAIQVSFYILILLFFYKLSFLFRKQDAAGKKSGSFSYVAPEGQEILVKYEADDLGYRVVSNALPLNQSNKQEVSKDTEEVIKARQTHLAVHEATKSRSKRSLLAPIAHTIPLVYSRPSIYIKTYRALPITTTSSYNNVIHSKPYFYLFK